MNYGELHIHHPDGSTERFKIDTPAIQIARAETNDLVLKGLEVSRTHARFAVQEDLTTTLTDLESVNGVSVNGQAPRGECSGSPGGHGVDRRVSVDLFGRAGGFRTRGNETCGSVDVADRRGSGAIGSVDAAGLAVSSQESRSIELLHEVSVTLAETTTVTDVIEAAWRCRSGSRASTARTHAVGDQKVETYSVSWRCTDFACK